MPVQIVHKLRVRDRLLGDVKNVVEVVAELGTSEHTIERRRNQY